MRTQKIVAFFVNRTSFWEYADCALEQLQHYRKIDFSFGRKNNEKITIIIFLHN